MSGGKGKTIFDNISGFITLDEFQLSIVNHPLFQRLRRIKQNGFLNYVFTGAEHSRFAHSLGVFKNMLDLLENFEQSGHQLEKDEKDHLLLAALLHDIGHYPLSHTIEGLMIDLYGKKVGHHEKNAVEYIRNSSLGDLIEDHGIDLNLLSKIIGGTSGNQLFTQIMHSELDMDRLDYLIRDSVNCGLTYGMFDRHQLMRTLDIHDGQLVVLEKGRTAAEHYILSRYYMYSEIYSHHTSNAFNILAKEVYRELLDIGKAPELEEIRKSPEDYLWFDDNWFINTLFNIQKKEVSGRTWDFIKRILHRKPLKVAKEARCIVEMDGRGSEEYTTIDKIRRGAKIRDLILEETKIPEDLLFVSFPRTEISGLKPYYEPTTTEDVDERIEQAIRIKDGDTIYTIASNPNSLIRELATKTLNIGRVYTPEKYAEAVKEVIERY